MLGRLSAIRPRRSPTRVADSPRLVRSGRRLLVARVRGSEGRRAAAAVRRSGEASLN